MADTLIKVDLTQSPTQNENIHNRWHPDIPMACWVNPGDEFILETFDWTGGFIKNNDSADDVRDIDLSTVHYLSGPVIPGIGEESDDVTAGGSDRKPNNAKNRYELFCKPA